MKTNNHGGKRLNSGRPSLGKKKYLITSLPEHIDKIRNFIKQIHEKKK